MEIHTDITTNETQKNRPDPLSIGHKSVYLSIAQNQASAVFERLIGQLSPAEAMELGAEK